MIFCRIILTLIDRILQHTAQFVCKKLPDLKEVAAQLLDFAGDTLIWTLEGELGAGKTTLVQSICEVIGTEDLVNSPTYALVNEYLLQDGSSCYHFDFYRVSEPEEALDIGLEEYFYSGNRCFIEWPGIIEDFLPEEYVKIIIEIGQNHKRIFNVTKYG